MHNPYDPIHDVRCDVTPSAHSDPWRAQWIWYPSQLTAHLHARAVQRAVARCSYVSYPGNFHQPVHQLHVRYHTILTHAQTLRWRVPDSRSRIFVNGRALDFTRRTLDVPAGVIDVRMVIDFCATLPCVMLESDEIATDNSWQVSLDGHTWCGAETSLLHNRSDKLPDATHEVNVIIPVQQRIDGVVADEYALQAGESLVVDFFHLELGQVQWQVTGDTALTVQVGESYYEVIDPTPQTMEQLPLPAYVCSGYTTITLPERCVRFVRIITDAPCVISQVRFVARVTPLEYHGWFESSDAQLNAIWQAGAATLHACTHDFLLDGLRRDGLPWADQLSEVEGADCVFFDTDAARHSLVALTLPTPTNADDLGIIDQPMLLPLSFWHEWMHRGDTAFVMEYLERLRSLLDMYHVLQDERGLISAATVYARAPLRDSNWNFFPDWAMHPECGPDTRGTPAYAHMVLMRCYEVAAALEQEVGNRTRVHHYRTQARRLRQTLMCEFWDAERGVFINGYDRDGQRDMRVSIYAQIWGVLTDLIAPESYANVFETVIENSAYRPANYSLNHHWEFQAFIKAGRLPQALAVLRRVWGGWLALGHSRFPEDLRPDARAIDQLSMYGRPYANSLCHGWAGGAAVVLLSRGMLGISATAPGFVRCRIAPNCGDVAWVKGQMPTPHGVVSIEWDGVQGMLELPAITADLVGCVTTDGVTTIYGPGRFQLRALDI